MFKFFKSKSEKQKLEDRYKKLLEESYKLSTVNRKLSDEKAYEADQILQQIESLNKQ
ncbi:Lacal_2735 family protein [uncultured Tenacibaculum sp.]|uniref:Lacal_2735 family protein n=1 Tax=uncultured Tenacibaculum sp. TaxID=174713 RepID=UPI0026226B4F|nr:Lacal_2735 family protein [uncultured Tenacibaculum sp.]